MNSTKVYVPTAAEAAKSAKRYARLVALTCKIIGVQSPPEGYGPWEALVRVWGLYHTKLQCRDPLYAALHFIKWGVYPQSDNNSSHWTFNKGTHLEADTTELFALFCEELTSPGAAGAIELHAWELFKHLYYRVRCDDQGATPGDHIARSRVHQEFLNDRFDYMIHAHNPEDNRWADYPRYKYIIHRLLPSSSTWSEEAWLDESFVLQELDQNLGTNFQITPDSLTPIVQVVDDAMMNQRASGYILTKIPELPFAVAKRIWPTNTTDCIVRSYNAIIQEARRCERRAKRRKSGKLYPYELSYADVKTTGIHQLMNDLISLGVISDLAMKQLVFDMQFHQ